MPSVNSFEFNCDCGFRFRVRPDQGGKALTCPSCHKKLIVPAINVGPSGPTTPQPALSLRDAAMQVGLRLRLIGGPVSFTTILAYLGVGWAGGAFLCLILSLFSVYTRIAALCIFLAITAGVLHQLWLLLQARRLVLSRKELPLLWGLIHLVAWDPTEGILVLRNKNVIFSDDDLTDGRGGVRFVCPILGEEVALRVPLEVQTLDFSDNDVLTREYLKLSVRGTLRWRITDIRNFYLLISREMRSVTDLNHRAAVYSTSVDSVASNNPAQGPVGQLVYSSIEWLRGLAEAQTRTVVSKVGSGLLLADRVADEVPEIRTAGLFANGGSDFGDGTENLSERLHKSLRESVANYGIEIEDIALREVKFPDEIMQQCIEAAKTAYLPLIGHRQAQAKTAVLEREAQILGKEAVGAREIVSHAPPVALADFMANLLAKNGVTNTAPGIGMAVPAAMTATLAAQTAASQLSHGPATT